MEDDVLRKFNKDFFSRQDIFEHVKKDNCEFKETQLRYLIGKLQQNNQITRIGNNTYIKNKPDEVKFVYQGNYSNIATEVANKINNQFPRLDIRVWELRWLNEFLNHQIAHNKIFVEVERDACEFVYDSLSEDYQGKLMLMPSPKDLYRYGVNDGLIISHLVTESPKGVRSKYDTPLEKIIVDMFSNKLILSIVSKGDYDFAIQEMFNKYRINQTMLFRYARRRNKKDVITDFILSNTDIQLIEGE